MEIHIPDKYPFEPPRCEFLTRVYHPNIDDQGRICLDILKGPPKGTWNPAISIATMLLSLRVLLANPNPDDPLLVDVANEFKENKTLFNEKAREYTRRYATPNTETIVPGQPSRHLDEGPRASLDTAELETRKLVTTDLTSSSYVKTAAPASAISSISLSATPETQSSQDLSQPSLPSSDVPRIGAKDKRVLAKHVLKKPDLKTPRTRRVAGSYGTNSPLDPENKPAALDVTTTPRMESANEPSRDALEVPVTVADIKENQLHSSRTGPSTSDIGIDTAQDNQSSSLEITTIDHNALPETKRDHELHRSPSPPFYAMPKRKKSRIGKENSLKECEPTNETPVVSSRDLDMTSQERRISTTVLHISEEHPCMIQTVATSTASPTSPSKPRIPRLQQSISADKLPIESIERRSSLKSNHGPLQPIERDSQSNVVEKLNESATDFITRDKGKGKAIEEGMACKEHKEMDENMRTTASPLSKSRNMENVTPSSFSNTNELPVSHSQTRLLTVAQKRSLLKKHRPK